MNITLRRPFAGWSGIILEDEKGNTFSSALSYIDNVVYIFGKNFTDFVENYSDVVLHFDEEGSDVYYILSPGRDIKCISEYEKTELKELEIEAKDFIKEISKQLLNDVEYWSQFYIFSDDVSEWRNEFEENKKYIKETFTKILEDIDKKEEVE